MKVLITGICGFVGSTVARTLRESRDDIEIIGIDNFRRAGSETNQAPLRELGISVVRGDIRFAADVDGLPSVDWIIDAAALPSVLSGVDGKTQSRDVVEHNLVGTINLLEYAKRHHAGFTLISTSRVYSISPLSNLEVEVHRGAFRPDLTREFPCGLSPSGITEAFSTQPPVSLYGSTKVASETLALEYGATFDLPIFINRCGVLAGAGQFGRPDQGILSYWIHSHLRRRPLRYIGFEGTGHQVRDALHPRDLVPLLTQQMECAHVPLDQRIVNLGGGLANAISLRQLTAWCDDRFGPHHVDMDPKPRRFDVPWLVMDYTKSESLWNWHPQTSLLGILDEIAEHAQQHPEWLDLSAPS